jgi:transcriptional regulator with XRE-family HTH domain
VPTALEILRRRLDGLLQHNERTRKDFAIYLGKAPSWATEFFQGRHGMTLRDLDRAARFFGVSVPQLFELDGHRFRERRIVCRRQPGCDRRKGKDRRKVPWAY